MFLKTTICFGLWFLVVLGATATTTFDHFMPTATRIEPFDNETQTDNPPPDEAGGLLGSLLEQWLQSLGFSLVAKGGMLVTLWGSVFAGAFACVFGLGKSLWSSLVQVLYTHVVVRDTSPRVFTWLNHTLAQREEMRDWKTTQFEVSETWNQLHRGKNSMDDGREFVWLPQSNKTYRVTFENRYIKVRCEENEKAHGSPFMMQWQKQISLSCFWSDRALIDRFILHAKKEYDDKMKEKTAICTSQVSRGQISWNSNQTRPSRPISTVILPGNTSEKLIQDVEDFMASEEWYYARGIPYRRGYLLYGPPGTGKTSFVTAVAGHLRVTICILNLSSPSLTDDCLSALFSSAPKHSIILLEDIDAALDPEVIGKRSRSRKDQDPLEMGMGGGGGGGGVTLSGLLNAIDGVAAQEGKMLFMTTNHLEKLDPALVRPGRMDVHSYFGYAGKEEVAKLFRRFYSEPAPQQDIKDNKDAISPAHQSSKQLVSSEADLDQLAVRFAEEIPEQMFTLAEVQGHLMNARRSPQEALESVANLLSRQRKTVGPAEPKHSKDQLVVEAPSKP